MSNGDGGGGGSERVSTHTTYLARMYAAEAMVHLSRFNGAIKHLNPVNFTESESEEFVAVLVNLATTWICKNALDKAHKNIHKALTIDAEYAPALRMLVYLHMRMGNNHEAIKILKHRRPIPVKQLMQTNDTA